jgi:hypothetical protein
MKRKRPIKAKTKYTVTLKEGRLIKLRDIPVGSFMLYNAFGERPDIAQENVGHMLRTITKLAAGESVAFVWTHQKP